MTALPLTAAVLAVCAVALALAGSPALDAAAGFLLFVAAVALAGWVTRIPTRAPVAPGYVNSPAIPDLTAPTAPRHAGDA